MTSPSVAAHGDGDRIGGRDRIETSIAVARAAYPDGASVAYLASATNLVDALTAGSLADGPVLFVSAHELDPRVRHYLEELRPTRVIAIGGSSVVPEAILEAAGAYAQHTERLSGRTRVETANAVAERAFPSGADVAYVVDGFANHFGSPDAVVGGQLRQGPILFAQPRRGITPETASTLRKLQVKETVQLGGQPIGQFTPQRYLAGRDRYGTAVHVATEQWGLQGEVIYLANGETFADAMTGGTLSDGPLLLTQSDSLPPIICDYIRRSDATRVKAIGGSAVVSPRTLQRAQACTARPEWPTSGYQVGESTHDYYAADKMPLGTHEGLAVCDRMVVDASNRSVCADDGVRVVAHQGKRVYNPVSIAQYALYNIARYRETGELQPLLRAKANASKLIDMAQRGEGTTYWFPYEYDFALAGDQNNVILAPWYSGMAQGQALSVFSRLSTLEPDESQWREAADSTFRSFLSAERVKAPFAVTYDREGRIWFEEYAGNTKPLWVINGQIFALFGLYDYWYESKDEEARLLIDGGATTVREVFDTYRRSGQISLYCTQMPRCRRISSEKYHGIHVNQLQVLAELTGDSTFQRQAEILRRDHYRVDAATGLGLTW